jgi:hypothetical protein
MQMRKIAAPLLIGLSVAVGPAKAKKIAKPKIAKKPKAAKKAKDVKKKVKAVRKAGQPRRRRLSNSWRHPRRLTFAAAKASCGCTEEIAPTW